MIELVHVSEGKVMVTSKQVADSFEIKGGHRYVLSVIRKIISKSGEFGEQKYSLSSYRSEQNKVLPCFEMDRDGFVLLAMGFDGDKALEWKIKYINAFNQMERMLSGEDSVMRQFDKAIKMMEEDKAIASQCGKGLQGWKDVRKDHIAKIEDLRAKAQLLLNFK